MYVPSVFFFFNDTATTEIYTLSLHDALPISEAAACEVPRAARRRLHREGHQSALHRDARNREDLSREGARVRRERSEEHTSELQSRQYLVCRLLLEKKKIQIRHAMIAIVVIA